MLRVPRVPRVPRSIGVVGSVYSAAQIVGGIAMGFLSDSVLGRRGTLLVSMIGAGVAYYLVAVADSLATLILSRVIVGLVKQTMTASTAVRHTHTRARAHSCVQTRAPRHLHVHTDNNARVR